VSVSTKLVAVMASAAVLAGGTTMAIASQNSAATTAVPAVVAAAVETPAAYQVRVWADQQTYDVEVGTPTVAAALSAAGIRLGKEDRVSPGRDAAAPTGTIIEVQRVRTTKKTTEKDIAFTTRRVNDSSLLRGTTRVRTKGVAGVRTTVTKVVTVDGKVESRTTVSSEVTRKPVTRVLAVGTKAPVRKAAPAEPSGGNTSGAGLNLARASMWDRIARCESGGNWSINTGNGYYGGLQFNLQTWLGVNGDDFARYPHQASRAEQITVANRLYAQRGLQPWGCRHAA